MNTNKEIKTGDLAELAAQQIMVRQAIKQALAGVRIAMLNGQSIERVSDNFTEVLHTMKDVYRSDYSADKKLNKFHAERCNQALKMACELDQHRNALNRASAKVAAKVVSADSSDFAEFLAFGLMATLPLTCKKATYKTGMRDTVEYPLLGAGVDYMHVFELDIERAEKGNMLSVTQAVELYQFTRFKPCSTTFVAGGVTFLDFSMLHNTDKTRVTFSLDGVHYASVGDEPIAVAYSGDASQFIVSLRLEKVLERGVYFERELVVERAVDKNDRAEKERAKLVVKTGKNTQRYIPVLSAESIEKVANEQQAAELKAAELKALQDAELRAKYYAEFMEMQNKAVVNSPLEIPKHTESESETA